jgi:hypothetical protein
MGLNLAARQGMNPATIFGRTSMKLVQWFALSCLLATPVVAEKPASAPAQPVNAGFEKMKTLVGDWRGKTADGKDVTVTYRLVAAGSAIEEHLSFADMVTMYHLDGKDLMLTHYCAAGNQPRMRAGEFKDGDKTLKFVFRDATNLPDKKAMYMHDVTFTFVDADHLTAEWTHFEGGKAAGKVVMNLERAKN